LTHLQNDPSGALLQVAGPQAPIGALEWRAIWLALLMISDFGKVRKKRYREVTCKLQVKYERRKEHNPRQKRERICAQECCHSLLHKERIR